MPVCFLGIIVVRDKLPWKYMQYSNQPNKRTTFYLFTWFLDSIFVCECEKYDFLDFTNFHVLKAILRLSFPNFTEYKNERMNDGPNFRAIFRLLKHPWKVLNQWRPLKTWTLYLSSSTFIRYLRVSKLNIGHSSTHVTCSNCFSVYNTDLRSFLSWSN